MLHGCIFVVFLFFFFFQAEDGIRDYKVTGVQTCALPISGEDRARVDGRQNHAFEAGVFALSRKRPIEAQNAGEGKGDPEQPGQRSEEHTSELQSPCNLVCRLLLEKKKNSTPCFVLKSQRV